jgi:hypothetical protein
MLERSNKPYFPARIKPETLEALDGLRANFRDSSCEIEWFQPEVHWLDNKKIIIAPSGVYWADNSQPAPQPVAGNRKRTITNLVEELNKGCFSYGGQEAAQAVLDQCREDYQHL